MESQMTIRCPNCGSWAQRFWSDRLPDNCQCSSRQIMQTECPTCDYFLSMCWPDGKVLEAYAPGIEKPLGKAKGKNNANPLNPAIECTPASVLPVIPLIR